MSCDNNSLLLIKHSGASGYQILSVAMQVKGFELTKTFYLS